MMTDRIYQLLLIRLRDLFAEMIAIGFDEKEAATAIHEAVNTLWPENTAVPQTEVDPT